MSHKCKNTKTLENYIYLHLPYKFLCTLINKFLTTERKYIHTKKLKY